MSQTIDTHSVPNPSAALAAAASEPYSGEDFTDDALEPSDGAVLPRAAEAPSALRDITAVPPSSSAEPFKSGAGGDVRPYLTGRSFAAALDYVLVACPENDENALLNYIVVHHNPSLRRFELGACDTFRWHMAFVPAPGDLEDQGTFRWPRADAAQLRDAIKFADKTGVFANVRPTDDRQSAWEIAYGQSSPIALEVATSTPHDGWRPPRFVRGAGAGAAAAHDAAFVAQAMKLWKHKGVRVVIDEVDSQGRRHITLSDEFGSELARAVLVQLGQTDGVPESSQSAFPGTLSPKEPVVVKPPAVAAPAPRAPTKAKAKPKAREPAKKSASPRGGRGAPTKGKRGKR